TILPVKCALDISYNDAWPVCRDELLAGELDRLICSLLQPASGPPQSGRRDEKKCCEQRNIRIRLVENGVPPLDNTAEDQHGGASKANDEERRPARSRNFHARGERLHRLRSEDNLALKGSVKSFPMRGLHKRPFDREGADISDLQQTGFCFLRKMDRLNYPLRREQFGPRRLFSNLFKTVLEFLWYTSPKNGMPDLQYPSDGFAILG